MNKIKYVEPEKIVDSPLWWHSGGLTQTATGYGAKLTTRRKAIIGGRAYRIYATCYGNAASCWVMVKGEKLHIR